jgi:transposase-like protein
MAVGWYLRFSLSYRDVEELLVERGLDTDHVTVWRWVQRYAPELSPANPAVARPVELTPRKFLLEGPAEPGL